MAYNADRRRQLWEQTARDDLKELTELRALVRKEEEKADAQKKESYARGAEVGETCRLGEDARGQGENAVMLASDGMPDAACIEQSTLGRRRVLFFHRELGPYADRPASC